MPQGKKARSRATKKKNAMLQQIKFCSFCGKDSKSVKTLIQGPAAFICNECVAVCNKVLRGGRLSVWAGWDELGDVHLLAILRSSVEAERSAIKIQVDALRRRKVKWETIGKALGVSRQAAWQRFSPTAERLRPAIILET